MKRSLIVMMFALVMTTAMYFFFEKPHVAPKSLPTAMQSVGNVERISANWGQTVHADVQEIVERTRVAFRAMHDLRSYVGKDEIRRDFLDQLLLDGETIALATQILTDNPFTRSAFGEDQAIARIYAIQLLVRKAHAGDPKPLEFATIRLADRLSRRENISRGEMRDLEDLLLENLKLVGVKRARDETGELLARFRYSPPLDEAFRNAFFFALRAQVKEPELSQFFDRYFS